MRIAAATREDVEDVLRIEQVVAEAPHWAAAEYTAIVAAQTGPVRRCLLVAREGSAVAGFAVGKAVAGEAELESVVVEPASRRCGAGRALCDGVIAWAWEQGAARLDLEVRVSSAGAITLYRRLGFIESGRRRGYYADPIDDALLMTLTCGAGL